ncbi:MAG: alanine--glyoxylate aminotransferase family protein [Gammaproteobacteria bacterium]|nr:alanine--glyoxylate aminotransferase family protein [Gammaproteobacteria bacterium]
MKVSRFTPPARVLLGPGPSDVPPRVLLAMAQPTIGHLDPAFITMMEEIKALLQYAFKTGNSLTLPISAPGSAGMEASLANLVEAGDKVVVCRNGVFGGRMADIVGRVGGTAVLVDNAFGEAVDPDRLADALKKHPDTKVVAFVHAETSTGVLSDARVLAGIAHRAGALVVADTVTAVGGVPVETDAWGLDVVYAGTQKCLSCPPGLSPLTLNERAMEKVKGRRMKPPTWFLDLGLLMGYWGTGKRVYHHTAPVNLLYALHEALVMLQEEGLEASFARHRQNHEQLVKGLEGLGLEMAVPAAIRLPQLNSVLVPPGIDEARVRADLLAWFGIEIGAGLGELAGKIWRIGLMGQGSNRRNVALCVEGLRAALAAQGYRP